MPDTTSPSPTPELETKPRPTLVYGWPGGDLAFAPLDEARLYATLRSGEGFPMTWGEFRSRFGEETCEEFIAPLVDGAVYASFEEYLQTVFDGEWDDHDPRAEATKLYDWAEWYRTYPGRRLNSLGFGACFEYCVAVLAESDRELAARELRDWFTWSTARGLVEGDEFGTFEQSVRSYRDKLLERVRNEYYDLPTGDEGRPAEDTDIAQFSDGMDGFDDKPTDISYWPAQRMLDWFPEEVADEYGRVVDSVHDGEFLELETERWEEIVAALEALGFPCVEDNALMTVASGY